MLSDGAGALLLQNKPNPNGISLRIEWMEAYSTHELEACMYAGGDKLENGDIKPWSDYHPDEWLKESVFAIKQDVKVLDEHILVKGAESMSEALKKQYFF
jgi:3-oxoacyl-[acyl-carrier-protein] synthase-3